MSAVDQIEKVVERNKRRYENYLQRHNYIRTVLARNSKRAILGTTAVLMLYLVLTPFVFLAWSSFWSGNPGSFEGHFTLQNFIAAYTSPNTYFLYINSFMIAIGTLAVASFFGISFAWILARTNIPTKGLLELTLLSPYAIAGFLFALMYVFTWAPDVGLLYKFFEAQLGIALPSVYSVWGIILVTGINKTPTFYLLTIVAFRNLDPSFEEAARIHGAGIFQTIKEISLPVAKPAIAAAMMLTFISGLGIFSIVAILGIPSGFHVFATKIWVVSSAIPANYGLASVLSASLVVITAVLIWYYRKITKRKEDFMTITGSGYKPKQWDLGKWRWPVAGMMWLVLGVFWILPGIVMVLISFHRGYAGHLELHTLTLEHYKSVLNNPTAQRAFENSLIVGVVGGVFGTAMATLVAYYTERTEFRFRGFVDFMSMTPKAATGIVMGISVLFTYLWAGKYLPIAIYGTLLIIIIGIVTNYIPTSSRMAVGNIVQIHDELEEVARVSGATWIQQMREIFLPLFSPTLAVIFFYLFIHLFRNLGIAIMTYSPGSEVVAIIIFNKWYMEANLEATAALSTIFIGFMAALLVGLRLIGIKFYEVA